ncbi:MAG: transposase [Victivallaceae bacterium]|jgi:REP element-mobilizing transposase RayT
MKYNPDNHHRHSIRLKGYDYAQPGAYFITICTQNRACLFGEIVDGEMVLNDAGKMVDNEWLILPGRFANIRLRGHVVMPNHFHAILEIVDGGDVPVDVVFNENQMGQPQGIAPTAIEPMATIEPATVGDIIGAFQSIVTVKYIRGVKTEKWQSFNKKLWQRNYWEHIVRDESELDRICRYIKNNPRNWRNDALGGEKGNAVREQPAEYGKEIWMV